MPAAAAAQAAIGVIQAGVGIVQSISGNSRLKKLRGMRTAYQTPQEYYDLNAMALNRAQTGYGAQTLDYLTSQTDRALSSSLGAATSLGADANSIADIYDRNSQNIFKISAENELQQVANFNKVYESTQTLANQKVAEWADKEAKLKDDMAAAAQKVAAGNKNLESGLNMVIGGIANKEKGDLLKTKPLTRNTEVVNTIPIESRLSNNYDMSGYTSTLRGLPNIKGVGQLPSYTSSPYEMVDTTIIPSWYR